MLDTKVTSFLAHWTFTISQNDLFKVPKLPECRCKLRPDSVTCLPHYPNFLHPDKWECLGRVTWAGIYRGNLARCSVEKQDETFLYQTLEWEVTETRGDVKAIIFLTQNYICYYDFKFLNCWHFKIKHPTLCKIRVDMLIHK